METSRVIVAMNATIKDQEKCKAAMEAIVADAFAEKATKTHWWCLADDGKSLFVLEQYDDEDAAVAHITADPPARGDFFASIDIEKVTVYGDLTPELKAMFDPLGPVYMSYYGGFSK